MSNQGIQFAKNTGSGSTPTEDMYKELATENYVDDKLSLEEIEYSLLTLDDGVYNIELAVEGTIPTAEYEAMHRPVIKEKLNL